MYLVAFAVTYLLLRYQLRKSGLPVHPDEAPNLFFWVIVGLLIGARIAATTIYDPSGYYLTRPWLIFWPFSDGRFTGLQGMSYHGGLIGAVTAFLVYCRARKLKPLFWGDMIAASVPLGYTFGRLGNFINGELYGRVSTASWAMVFPSAPSYPAQLKWVRRVALEAGMPIAAENGMINLPRHPSQLYEAALEGVLLWLVLWILVRPRKRFAGAVVSWYLILYGVFRFAVEYFREPDPGLGFVIRLSDTPNPPQILATPWNFTMGQLLSAGMVVIGLGAYFVFLYIANRKPKIETFDV
jgi:phosphatidylglycerol:prolipoprotein diacylglycerol transferase